MRRYISEENVDLKTTNFGGFPPQTVLLFGAFPSFFVATAITTALRKISLSLLPRVGNEALWSIPIFLTLLSLPICRESCLPCSDTGWSCCVSLHPRDPFPLLLSHSLLRHNYHTTQFWAHTSCCPTWFCVSTQFCLPSSSPNWTHYQAKSVCNAWAMAAVKWRIGGSRPNCQSHFKLTSFTLGLFYH